MNPVCWAIWLVQNQHALNAGGWKVESERARRELTFENLYRWLQTQHARGEWRNLYDTSTGRLLKRYKLPFKTMTVPPDRDNLFKWIKGARRLSNWIFECQQGMHERERPSFMGFPYGIIAQKPAELVAAPAQLHCRRGR